MMIGARLRQLREEKGLTQADIEEKTGLMTCYISRVENGHKVPSIATLERFAWALGIPLHHLFCENGVPPALSSMAPRDPLERLAETSNRITAEDAFILKLNGLLNRIDERDRDVLLVVARKMAARQHPEAS
jgi:transcriptional regulator with XRE-family HTH domain